ncbi:hypothetical protein [Alkaliphilus sp. B6464]|uniref:hypothetical protein n=1 Tax=Alkaliphilus sp. B6464 TaxID=2731219 RepID=UPI001BA7816B|nr:hypothetical protein [Alkaliphilus sp. B6464]QUH21786.1 hypothetical protein HYG84_17780 [Alkaliphilus sp. B6464]
MNIQEFANMLNGREYGDEITKDECDLAKELGFVVVFGYSDDNTELRGVINDEINSYDGGQIFVNNEGIFTNCACNCSHSQLAKLKYKIINVLWCKEDQIPWTYETDITHATFNILEDDEMFCRGIVFDIKKLQ